MSGDPVRRVGLVYGVVVVAGVTGISYAVGGPTGGVIGAIVSMVIAGANLAISPWLYRKWIRSGGGSPR